MVKTNLHSLLPQGRESLRCCLINTQLADFTVGTLVVDSDAIKPGLVEPVLSPLGQISVCRLAQLAHKVIQISVFIGEFFQVIADASAKIFLAKIEGQLF